MPALGARRTSSTSKAPSRRSRSIHSIVKPRCDSSQLPCRDMCGELARPGVVWFGEEPCMDRVLALVEEGASRHRLRHIVPDRYVDMQGCCHALVSATGSLGGRLRAKSRMMAASSLCSTSSTAVATTEPRAEHGKNTNGLQFLVTVTQTPHLDGKLSVFGVEVARGKLLCARSRTRRRTQVRPVFIFIGLCEELLSGALSTS